MTGAVIAWQVVGERDGNPPPAGFLASLRPAELLRDGLRDTEDHQQAAGRRHPVPAGQVQ